MNIYQIKNLTFSYDNERKIFNDANLLIDEGKLYSLLGKNGIGKSTLFSILLNLKDDYKGEIFFMGENLRTVNIKKLARKVGFVPQTPKLSFDYSAKDYVAMGLLTDTTLFQDLNKKHYEKVFVAFEKLGIERLMNKSFFDMSGGEKQLVVIARSIVSNPKIILFDEPTAHLDIYNQYKVLKIIKNLNELGYTIIVSTHDPNQVTLLKENVIIVDENGAIESGDTVDIINKNSLKKIYNADMEVEDLQKYDRRICFFDSL